MKRFLLALIFVLMSFVASGQTLVGRGGWVSAYYPSWAWSAGAANNLVADNCYTHVLLVSGSPNGTGISWNTNAQSMLTDMVPTLHAAGIKCIFQLCCGWSTSMSAPNRAAFITSLLNVVTTYNLDGIDIDDEPTSSTIGAFAHDLRDSMTARYGAGQKEIVTYASLNEEYFDNGDHQYFDQINIQGYDLISPSWSSCGGVGNDYYVVWHQGPMYHGGSNCPLGNPMTNLYTIAMDFVNVGVPRSKIGISTRWNGSVWKGGSGTSTGGVTTPLQTWSSAPAMWNDMPNYYWGELVGQTESFIANLTRNHDATRLATYLSHNDASDANDFFISYDDGWACGQKIKMVVDSLFGGVYIWTTEGQESNTQQPDSTRYYSTIYTSSGSPAAPKRRLIIRR